MKPLCIISTAIVVAMASAVAGPMWYDLTQGPGLDALMRRRLDDEKAHLAAK